MENPHKSLQLIDETINKKLITRLRFLPVFITFAFSLLLLIVVYNDNTHLEKEMLSMTETEILHEAKNHVKTCNGQVPQDTFL